MSFFGQLFHRTRATPAVPWIHATTANLNQPAPRTRRYLAGSDYFLPKDQEEEFRLNFQHHALYHAIGNHYVAPIGPATRLMLDVGTGTGIWASEMARLFPLAEVFGLDVDPACFKPDVPENCLLRAGNILTGLPFPDQVFDYTHQRLLVAAILAANWPGVVRELVRVTRVDGWVELVEIDHQMQNPGPACIRMASVVETVGKGMGFDGEIMRHLDDLLRQAGLREVEMQPIVIPVGEWGGRVGSMLKRDLLSTLQGLKELYCQRGNLPLAEFDGLVRAMADEWEAYRSSCTFYAVYGKRVQI